MSTRHSLSGVCLLLLLTGCTAEQTAQSELQKGIELFDANNVDASIEPLNKAILNKAEFPEAFFRRGLARLSQKQFTKAVIDMQDATRLKPDYPPYVLARGLAFLGNEQHDEALRDFANVKQMKPSAEIAAKADEMIAVATRMKSARGSAITGVETVMNLAQEPPAIKSWVAQGFLGRSQFCASHPVWSIVLYILGHLVAVSMLMGMWISGLGAMGRHLTDNEKAGIFFVCLLIGATSYFLAWGYSYWGLWILCVFWTIGIGGNVANAAPNMRRM